MSILYRVEWRQGDEGPWRVREAGLEVDEAQDLATKLRRKGFRARLVAEDE